ncbi:hypothetical protein EYZ11_007384 [Aspergillus tanneri]|uniref:Uncharacterized protein n=1 Tax=Aspergillus tanneri TaxID=1220188 RepID=A0A4S3JIS4_9EURO|nr:hypothetical protein EYZ11_007384 [Aspergillus tanneri]
MTLSTIIGDPVLECGDIEVMAYDPNNLPQGVAPSDVRKIAHWVTIRW